MLNLIFKQCAYLRPEGMSHTMHMYTMYLHVYVQVQLVFLLLVTATQMHRDN